MKCKIHDCEMDFVPGDGGEIPDHWHCEQCRIEEEKAGGSLGYEEYLATIEPSRCGYCGSQAEDGYCWASPDGLHHHG